MLNSLLNGSYKSTVEVTFEMIESFVYYEKRHMQDPLETSKLINELRNSKDDVLIIASKIIEVADFSSLEVALIFCASIGQLYNVNISSLVATAVYLHNNEFAYNINKYMNVISTPPLESDIRNMYT